MQYIEDKPKDAVWLVYCTVLSKNRAQQAKASTPSVRYSKPMISTKRTLKRYLHLSVRQVAGRVKLSHTHTTCVPCHKETGPLQCAPSTALHSAAPTPLVSCTRKMKHRLAKVGLFKGVSVQESLQGLYGPSRCIIPFKILHIWHQGAFIIPILSVFPNLRKSPILLACILEQISW